MNSYALDTFCGSNRDLHYFINLRFGEICKATERRDFGKMANSLLNPPTLTGDAIVHGQVHEASALKKFSEVTGKIVQATGKCLKRGLISHTFM
jgi:hypothetical protein